MSYISSEKEALTCEDVRTSFEDRAIDPSWKLLQELIQAHVVHSPDALAIVSEDVHLTYGMLDHRANQLARSLLKQGVGPEICVGIYQERSCEMIVSMYAVLKAGGAYVPLDPSYPLERLMFMLDDAQIQTLITTHNLKPELTRDGMQPLYLEDEPLIDGQPMIDVPYAEHPDMSAYVIYTSGSTGKPKGVQITQRGLHNLVSWHQQAFELTPQDRASQVANLSFDAAGWEIWPYLASGATIYIVPEEIRTQPLQLLDWLKSVVNF